METTWSFTLEPSEVVAAVAQRPFGEPINLIGRPLASRQVMYKYLNPNMVAVATQVNDVLRLRLVDTVTGAILHSSLQPHAPYASLFIYCLLFCSLCPHLKRRPS